MQERFDFLVEEFNRGVRFKKLILLSGDRELSDTEPAILGVKTQTDMMRYLYSILNCPELKTIPIEIVEAPKKVSEEGGLERPGTREAVDAWLATNPKPGHCLFFSNMPFCSYQHSVLKSILPDVFEIETVGPGAREDTDLAVHMDNITRWMEWQKAYLARPKVANSNVQINMALARP